MLHWIEELLFSPMGYAGMGVVLGWGGRALLVHVLSRFSSPLLRGVLSRVWDELRVVAEEAAAAYTAELSRGKADGVLTDEERKAARHAAYLALKKHVGLKAGLGHLVKIATGSGLDKWLKAKVEETLS
jgi:hypothetical protein